MIDLQNNYKNKIFSLPDLNFDTLALELYRYQSLSNPVYKRYQKMLGINYKTINSIKDIPFLPIGFFRSHKILCKNRTVEIIFESSGTTASEKSKHFVHDAELYRKSLFNGFKYFFGNPDQYSFVFLLPGYLQNKASSLLYMVKELSACSTESDPSFYINDVESLFRKMNLLQEQGKKIFLWGLSSALVDFFNKYKSNLSGSIIMETGGMKGRKPELTRMEMHAIISENSGVKHVFSEYGMTELLSQAYSKGNGVFKAVPWMKIFIRDTNDPLQLLGENETGCINIIDLANIHSCAFIATDDLGRMYHDGSFEVIGRMDNSIIRGCNLMSV